MVPKDTTFYATTFVTFHVCLMCVCVCFHVFALWSYGHTVSRCFTPAGNFGLDFKCLGHLRECAATFWATRDSSWITTAWPAGSYWGWAEEHVPCFMILITFLFGLAVGHYCSWWGISSAFSWKFWRHKTNSLTAVPLSLVSADVHWATWKFPGDKDEESPHLSEDNLICWQQKYSAEVAVNWVVCSSKPPHWCRFKDPLNIGASARNISSFAVVFVHWRLYILGFIKSGLDREFFEKSLASVVYFCVKTFETLGTHAAKSKQTCSHRFQHFNTRARDGTFVKETEWNWVFVSTNLKRSVETIGLHLKRNLMFRFTALHFESLPVTCGRDLWTRNEPLDGIMGA